MRKITKRDILIFILGMFAFFLFDVIYNWEESVEIIKAGYQDGYNTGKGKYNTDSEEGS